METFLLGLAFVVGGIFLGWRLKEIHTKIRTQMLYKQFQEELERTDTEDSPIHITIEKHGPMFYVYKKGSSEFMGQGSSKEELEDVLRDRFPGRRFACEEKILIEVGFI